MRTAAIVFLAAWGAWAWPAWAQRLPDVRHPGPGANVAVQLPSFYVFSASSTVLVPDRGWASLGGVHYFAERGSCWGSPLLPGARRSRETAAGAATLGVSAWVHDFQVLEEELGTRTLSSSTLSTVPRVAGRLPAETPPLPDLAEIERRHAFADREKLRAAQRQFAQGQAAEKAGNKGAARVYYQMASRHATEELRQAIRARLKHLAR